MNAKTTVALKANVAAKAKFLGVAASLALFTLAGATSMEARFSPISVNHERQTDTVKSKFYCNMNALSATERAHHRELSEKLMAVRKQMVEMESGYEFQFSPSEVSLAELADWVAAEGRCCPFFDFHIDVEHEGTLLCLRLAGEPGIKAFIRSEFHVRGK